MPKLREHFRDSRNIVMAVDSDSAYNLQYHFRLINPDLRMTLYHATFNLVDVFNTMKPENRARIDSVIVSAYGLPIADIEDIDEARKILPPELLDGSIDAQLSRGKNITQYLMKEFSAENRKFYLFAQKPLPRKDIPEGLSGVIYLPLGGAYEVQRC